ncbi:MAG: plasmid recombination protein, partial [Enterococcus thailandicus]|nr:plasmid recombination protein [Enterococcus thailandicus]
NDYMIDFEKRNPTLKVFNAVMHLDEETPHLHIDFVPVAEGYKKGLSKRNSISKALGGQMVDWYEREREHIKELAKSENIEIIQKNEPKRSYIPIIEYKALKESSKYVLDAFKENLKHMEDMNKGFTEYKLKYDNAEQRIENTIKSNSKYSKGIFGGSGSYYIQENDMYKLTGTLLRQFLGDDYKLFTNKAEKLISSCDFDENKLMQNLATNEDLFKEINKLELENKRLKQIEKDYNSLKSELDYVKDHIKKTTEEKYRNEIQQIKKDLAAYKEAYINSNSEKKHLIDLFNKYDLSEVVEEKKKNEPKYKNKNTEIEM